MKGAAGLISLVALLLLAAYGEQAVTSEPVTGSAAQQGDRCPGMAVDPPGRRDFIVGGRVAFPAASNRPGWRQGDATQASAYPGHRVFAKTALFVRGADPIRLRMKAPGEMDGWTARRPTKHITLQQGPECAGTGWHWFAGGPLTPRPGGCVKLRVTVGGHSQTVPFGVRKSCSTPAGRGAAHAGPAPPRVTCETRIQVVPRSGNPLTREMKRQAVEIGGVYFIGARYYARQPSRTLTPRPGRTQPVKTPILVPSGPAVTLELDPRSRSRSDLDVGLDQQAPYHVRGDAMTLEPCPPDAQVANRRVGRFTPFNAGFRVTGAQCIRLSVQVDGEAEMTRGRLAIGRRTCR